MSGQTWAADWRLARPSQAGGIATIKLVGQIRPYELALPDYATYQQLVRLLASAEHIAAQRERRRVIERIETEIARISREWPR